MLKPFIFSILFFVYAALCACGFKNDLYLPEDTPTTQSQQATTPSNQGATQQPTSQ